MIVINFFSHFSKPLWPNILGSESFPGIQIHSLCYRRNNLFKDKKVLIVGAGPSGMDIGLDIAEVAEKVSNKVFYFLIDL